MDRLTVLAALLLCLLLCSSGALATTATFRRPPRGDPSWRTGRILAKVSSTYCSEEPALSTSSDDSSTSVASVSVLSAAAIQAVTAGLLQQA
uniref:Uncharacterized protein n=1 Tax=Tetradesmus obliquus TaxID=3088 RepID=A0A383V6W1_TETOB|eukprot:jgi/Sobl393_1/16062/SZX61335.1